MHGDELWSRVKTDLCCQEDSRLSLIPTARQLLSISRELKQLRRLQQRERQKSNWFRLAKHNFAGASRFTVHFFAFTARLRRKMPNFTFFGGREHKTTTYFFFSWTSIALQNSTPETIANIWRIERDGINAIKFEAARMHFLRDVFAAVAVVVA